MRARFVAAVIALAAMLGAAGLAQAQGYRVGQSVSRVVTIGEKQIPLAQGEWRVAAVSRDAKFSEYGAFGVIESLLLFQTDESKQVRAALEIYSNALPVTDGWGVSKDCGRSDLHLAVTRYKAGWDGLCFFVYNAMTSDDGRSVPWLEGLGYARANGLRISSRWMAAGFRVANRRDIVDARYYFAPEGWGFAPDASARWDESPWHPKKVESDPAKVRFVRELVEWANAVDGYYLSGIKNRFSDTANVPAPTLSPANSARTAAEQASGVLAIKEERLKALEELLKAELITEEEFKRQRDLIIAENPNPGTLAVDPDTIALYKTLAYRPIVSFVNLFIDLYFVGTVFAAGILEVLQITVNSFKFYYHELAWDQFGFSGTRRDAARTLDFTYVGLNK